MQTIFLNCKTTHGTETIDEFTREKGQSYRDFIAYVKSMMREYHIAGIDCYRSQRACKDWN